VRLNFKNNLRFFVELRETNLNLTVARKETKAMDIVAFLLAGVTYAQSCIRTGRHPTVNILRNSKS
jgi:hypothetical protein